MTWTTPHTWVDGDVLDYLDGNDFIRGNVLHLRGLVDSGGLYAFRRSSVVAEDRRPTWKTITSFDFETFGKMVYAALAFNVVNGSDTWGPGTIVVGADDTTDIVEREGEEILRVAIRDGYTRSAAWQNLLRQRQQLARLLDQIEDGIETYRNVDSVFGYGAPACEYASLVDRAGHELSSRDRAGLNVVCQHLPRRARDWGGAVRRLERRKDDINNQMRAIGVQWRHRDLTTPGREISIAESSQVSSTRVITQTETIAYDRVFVRLFIDGELSREFIHDGRDRTDSGAFYIPNIPAGEHRVDLQWRSPQFTGHWPLSGTLISMTNFSLQMKEVPTLVDEMD